MKLIGYWMASLRDLSLPLPEELVGKMSEGDREAVCMYLQGGKLFETYRGYSWCRFGCGASGQEMGCREYTDGKWVWPEGLVHYVRFHSVMLPEDFILRVTSGSIGGNSESETAPTLDFWKEWAGKRQSSAIRERLKDALAAARAAEPEVVRAIIEEASAREKEGTEPCAYAGCNRRAVIGRKICARHMINDDEFHWRTAHLYALPHQWLTSVDSAGR